MCQHGGAQVALPPTSARLVLASDGLRDLNLKTLDPECAVVGVRRWRCRRRARAWSWPATGSGT